VVEHAYSTGVNLVAERPGQDDRVVIVGAHYDTVSAAVAGADDDASGVVAGLAVARALAGCALRHGLRFVAFDEEERGLRGSRAYARSLESSGVAPQVIANINLEMLGYDSNDDGRALLVDCDRPDTAFVTALIR
jgi:Zn-dependent M28 family amino/carboxypeptidase